MRHTMCHIIKARMTWSTCGPHYGKDQGARWSPFLACMQDQVKQIDCWLKASGNQDSFFITGVQGLENMWARVFIVCCVLCGQLENQNLGQQGKGGIHKSSHGRIPNSAWFEQVVSQKILGRFVQDIKTFKLMTLTSNPLCHKIL